MRPYDRRSASDLSHNIWIGEWRLCKLSGYDSAMPAKTRSAGKKKLSQNPQEEVIATNIILLFN